MAEWPCCHDPLRFSPMSLRFVPPPPPPRPNSFLLPQLVRRLGRGAWGLCPPPHRARPSRGCTRALRARGVPPLAQPSRARTLVCAGNESMPVGWARGAKHACRGVIEALSAGAVNALALPRCKYVLSTPWPSCKHASLLAPAIKDSAWGLGEPGEFFAPLQHKERVSWSSRRTTRGPGARSWSCPEGG